jgi:nucleotide-binding universal stress UspA family protein
MKMFERILVPLDGSPYSARAIPYSIEMAEKFDAQIIFLQVVCPANQVMPVSSNGPGIINPTINKILIQKATEEESLSVVKVRRYLRQKLRQVTEHNLRGSYHILVGNPAEKIIDFCKIEMIDLVVMMTTGKGGLKRAFLGSVADRIIREPGFPVLVIRSDIQHSKQKQRVPFAKSGESSRIPV